MYRHICVLFSITALLSGCIAASDPTVTDEQNESSEAIGVEQQALGALATPALSISKSSSCTNCFKLNWTPISGATRYRVQCDYYSSFNGDYCMNPYGCEYEFVPSGQYNTSMTVNLLSMKYPSTTHICRVRAGNDNQGSLWSPTQKVTTY